MSNVLFIKAGSKINISNNSLVIKMEEDKKLIPVHEVSCVVIENLQCSITAGVNVLCARASIPIIYCDTKYSPVAISNTFNMYHRQFFKLKEQIAWSEATKARLFKKIVIQKIKNQVELLEYLHKSVDVIHCIKGKIKLIDNSNFDNIEAQVAKLYFKELFGKKFVRFVDDEINTSLNYGYAIMRSVIKQMIVAKGLIPPLGIWHKSQFNNYNLADDIIEVFRPMVDYVTYHFIIKDDDFTIDERCYLQNTIFQKVKYGKNVFEYKECLNLYIDQISKYMNREISNISFPITDSELYEY